MSETPEVQNRLKAAVNSVSVPPYLEARIRNQIQTQPLRTGWMLRIASPVAAAAAVAVGLTIAYQLGHLRLTDSSQEAYIGSVSNQIPTLMRVGLRNHIRCAVFRKYPQNPPAVEELIQDMGARYAGIIPIVRAHVPGEYRLMMAHECSYRGRRYVHLSLKNDSNLMSVLVTRKTAGDSFKAEGMLPALTQAGIPMYESGVQRFTMTAFETRDYMVYLVSDMGKRQNSDLMLALAPSVKNYLGTLEL